MFKWIQFLFIPQLSVVIGKPGGISLTEAFELIKKQITFTLK